MAAAWQGWICSGVLFMELWEKMSLSVERGVKKTCSERVQSSRKSPSKPGGHTES
jgi:hypothetical protein